MPKWRQRERFERSDVPTAGPRRNVGAVIVIALVAVGMYLLVTTLWHRVQQVGGLSDSSLRTVIRSQPSASAPVEGFVASDHKISNTLVLLAADDGSLAQAQILSLDDTDGTGVIVNIPLDTKIVVDDAATTLAANYVAQGAFTCVAPLASAANLPMNHVLVGTTDIWEQLDSLRDVEIVALLGPAADILSTITSDLSHHDLLALASEVQAVGIANLRRIDAPVVPEQLEDGTLFSIIDQTALGVELGTLVSIEALPVEESPVE